jgi:hypothetical protein
MIWISHMDQSHGGPEQLSDKPGSATWASQLEDVDQPPEGPRLAIYMSWVSHLEDLYQSPG